MKLDRCAACHRSMGAQVSKIKHLKLDQWEDSQVARMKEARLILKRLHFWNIKGFKNQYVPDGHWSTPIRLETWMQSWNTSNGFLQATEKLTVLRPRLYVLFVMVFVLRCWRSHSASDSSRAVDTCQIRSWGVYPPWEAELHLGIYGGVYIYICTFT